MFNLNDVKVGEGSGSKYLGPGVYECKVESWEDKGTYIEYRIKASEGEKDIRFSKVKDTDSDTVKEIKSKSLKSFLINCGVTNFSTDQAAIASATGATVNVILRKREYWLNDRDTGMPTIRETVEFFGSRKKGVAVNFEERFNKPLSKDDREAYELALKAHEPTTETAEAGGANLPF
jgi:hypothetical protein